MNTKEAIQAMLDGKKVRVNDWDKDAYTLFDELTSNFILRRKDEDGDIDFNFLGYLDCIWESYEEPNPVQTVTIEKWLCKCIFDGEYRIIETSNIKLIDSSYEKVKLLDTYEVEL